MTELKEVQLQNEERKSYIEKLDKEQAEAKANLQKLHKEKE